MSGLTSAESVASFVDSSLARNPDKTGRLLNVLNDVQGAYRYLPPAAIERIAEEMEVDPAQIVRMGEFFNNLSLAPVGRVIVDVCDGTACHTLGAARLVSEFEKALGIRAGETTEDGAVTLRTVGCIGACGIAPVVVCDEGAYGRVRVQQVPALADEARALGARPQGRPDGESPAGRAAKPSWPQPILFGNADGTASEAPSEAVSQIERVERPSQVGAATSFGAGAPRTRRCASLQESPRLADHRFKAQPQSASQAVPLPMLALHELRSRGLSELAHARTRVTVGLGTCGRAAGARETYDALASALADALAAGPGGGGVALDAVGCRGLCHAEPLVEVTFPTGERAAFGNVAAEHASALAAHIAEGGEGELPPKLAALLIGQDPLASQQRRVMSNCGEVNPRSLSQYIARGGYDALAKALASEPSSIVGEVVESGLRGRGGGGFPTGLKWRAMNESGAQERYFIVNGDEGDPGAYMDRGLLESDPHRVLEGLAIACWATGVHQAYFFIRAEYPLALESVRTALEDARAAGIIGDDVLGSGFKLDVGIVRGAGAFLCGESTAMANVLENGECTTRPKPPHLTERGLWGQPTCVNNVETLANVPLIVEKGASWFREVGTAESPGTKIFSITGAAGRTGLAEIPLGISLPELVRDIAGAPRAHAVQVGGPSGAILPAGLDLEVSFEGLSGVNGMMGSGGFVVLGRDQCVVDTAAYLVRFSAGQSCRKCKPCREGLDECADILERLTRGEAGEDDLARLNAIAERNCASRLCGLGRTSLNPVLSSLRYFRDEYEAHMQKRCPGLACRALVSYAIIPEKCQGERCCLLTCPGNAVKGPFGKPGRIVGRLCQKCGMCAVTCPYGAVKKVSPAQ